ncbi:hypothetical protein HYPSUDRAFT_54980 [Hypholoma sublateritium FD-334 SS-4]|uniref:Protein kinase domain-containing protein n=1 Tax=Hypholoma sublateritium (strain FD-334 SS-4) TaxID=945553 RepID=A0A0D2MF99_HYPSF|nr:hypothetical protein HYPSUDRAFT_54980 [Hypholoma sublateritium FD-334 SS-4]
MDVNAPNEEHIPIQPSLSPTEPAEQEEMDEKPDVPSDSTDEHLWGLLKPMGGVSRSQIDFWRINPHVKVGSALDNQVVINHKKISPYQCIFKWDGKDNYSVCDFSDTGTYVGNNLIGKGKACILRDGQEVSFGSLFVGLDEDMEDDFRFVYRRVVYIPPPKGMLIDYDVSWPLGEGAMGTVLSVMHRTSGEWRAAKRIKLSKTRPRRGLSALAIAKREVTVMKQLKHPNICKMYESYVCEEDDTLDIIMEVVKGVNLREYALETENGLRVSQQLDTEITMKHITYQLCEAMANILLDISEQPPIVKVADFGTAKIVHDGTALLSSCGTAYFVAPEMRSNARLKGACTNLVDSFSLGAVLYYCLTLNVPFLRVQPDRQNQDLETHIKARKRDLTGLKGRSVSEEVTDIITRLMSTQPMRRYTMRGVLMHAWFKEYQPPYKFPREAYEDEAKEVTRELSRTPRNGVKGKGRSLGRALNLSAVLEEEAEAAARVASIPAGGDVEMALSTPMKKAKAATALRRSSRPNKGVPPKRLAGIRTPKK